MKPALIALTALCLGCLATGPALAVAQQSAGGDVMLFPPSVAPMTGAPAAPAAQQPRIAPPAARQPDGTAKLPGVTQDFVEPPPGTRSEASTPTAKNAAPPQKRAAPPHRRYAGEARHRDYHHYRRYAGGYRGRYDAGGGYAPSPLGILSLPFVAVQSLLGR